MPDPTGDATAPLRARRAPLLTRRARRRRFGSLCFLLAGATFGTAVYLLRTRAREVLGPRLPLLLVLIATMVALFALGSSAEAEVARLDDELAAIEAAIVRALREGARRAAPESSDD